MRYFKGSGSAAFVAGLGMTACGAPPVSGEPSCEGCETLAIDGRNVAANGTARVTVAEGETRAMLVNVTELAARPSGSTASTSLRSLQSLPVTLPPGYAERFRDRSAGRPPDAGEQGPLEVRSAGLASAAPTTVRQLAAFQGQEQTEWQPPDSNGAVSDRFVVTTVNVRMTVRDRSGNFLSTVHLNDFFAEPPAGSAFDPRCRFDPYARRFIVSAAGAMFDAPNASVLIGVSQTDDPTGNWFTYRVKADPPSRNWLDYPTLGFNSNWIVVSGNMHGNTPEDPFFTRLWAFDKAALYSGTLRVTALPGIGVSVQPAETYDPNLEDLYLLDLAPDNSVALHRLTGPVANPHTEHIANVAAPLAYESFPPGAPQLGGTDRINTGFPWMMDAVYRNGIIWGTHEVRPLGGPERSAVQYWAISQQGALEEFGRIDDANGVYYYGMGSVAVNADEDVMIGYTRFSRDTYPSAAYTVRAQGAPAFSPTVIYRPGFGTYGGGLWGDYSHTQVDPVNDRDFWTIQESSVDWGGWDTWWAQVSPEPGLTANVTVRLKSSPVTNNTNSPHPFFQIVNNGAPIPLENLAIRYWFDCDCSPTTELQSFVDWAGLLPSGQSITSTTHSAFMTTGASAQTHALEVTFVGNQTLNSGQTLQVETRFNTSTWANMQQFDDWSFEPFTTYRPANDVTVYVRGNLVMGREP